MKQLLLIVTLVFGVNAFAQDDNSVTLVVSGQGKTQEEAKQNALRSAIEQVFGAFISSRTEILDDSLIKDEIVSITNGNIQNYEMISEVELPNGYFTNSLRVTVSVTKLTSFVESKGVEVEFKGSLFGANLRQLKMNEEAELKAIINLCEVSNSILSKSLDYSIEVSEPVVAQERVLFKPKHNDYQVLITVKMTPNSNFDNLKTYFLSSIKSISMSASEINNYKSLRKKTFSFILYDSNETLYFRNPKTSIALQNLFIKSNQFLHNFIINSSIDKKTVEICCHNYSNSNLITSNIYNYHFKPEIWHLNSGNSEYKPNGSENQNPGFPIFNTITQRNTNTSPSRGLSSWITYFNYIYWLRDHSVLFDTSNYFYKTGSFYKDNGSAAHYSSPGYPYIDFPGAQEKFGVLSFEKIDYFNKYLAIYSIEELSKIKSFTIEPIIANLP